MPEELFLGGRPRPRFASGAGEADGDGDGEGMELIEYKSGS